MAGVLGMARTTASLQPAASSMAAVVTDAAIETIILSRVRPGAISAIRAGTWVGLTPSRMASAPRTASRLPVVTRMP